MECQKRLKPGMKGTKRFQQQYGENLLFVRYRYDYENKRRVTTVELIVDEAPLPIPRSKIIKQLYPYPNQNVLIKIGYHETDLRKQAKEAGAVWMAEKKRWKMPYHLVQKLGLFHRIDKTQVDDNGN